MTTGLVRERRREGVVISERVSEKEGVEDEDLIQTVIPVGPSHAQQQVQNPSSRRRHPRFMNNIIIRH